MKKYISILLTIAILCAFVTGCSSNETETTKRDEAIESLILSKPGGSEIPEVYLDVAYELALLATSDWITRNKPSGISINWTYIPGTNLLRLETITMSVSYPDGYAATYSMVLCR